MSNNAALNGAFEEKIQGISDYLKAKVLSPAVSEKESILKDAENQKKTIIDAAHVEAKRIVDEAHEKARLAESTLQSSLKIAAKQAIDQLKIALETQVLKEAASITVEKAMQSEELVTRFVEEIIAAYITRGVTDVEFAFSDSLRDNMKSYIGASSKKLLQQGVKITDERVPAGFTVVEKEKRLMYDFSAESVAELLATYLRPELRSYLFQK